MVGCSVSDWNWLAAATVKRRSLAHPAQDTDLLLRGLPVLGFVLQLAFHRSLQGKLHPVTISHAICLMARLTPPPH
jgi:hypothetical protein